MGSIWNAVFIYSRLHGAHCQVTHCSPCSPGTAQQTQPTLPGHKLVPGMRE